MSEAKRSRQAGSHPQSVGSRDHPRGGTTAQYSNPDGPTRRQVEALIWESHDVTARAPRPTSALLDGSAAERRRRRMERRAIAAVVRELPVRQQAGPCGSEAA